MAKLLGSALLFTLALLAQADDRTCYHLDGSTAPQQRPCTANGVTNCCSSTDLCMSNGLCFFQGQAGMILSRGSCTDKNWGSDCYAPCSKYNRNTGIALINLGYNFSNTEYCCANVLADNGSIRCKYEEPFKLPTGFVIPDAGFLTNNGGGNSSSTPSPTKMRSSSSCVAVEAGVSVPLGLIAIATAIWAIWERRRRRQMNKLFSTRGTEAGLVTGSRQQRVAELHTLPKAGATIPELMDTGREYKEAPGSQPQNG
ncbi:hypothetical protein N7492_010661 [Penicillium capsulatum]|uniref:Uncharacterized protein n=1 Tax=Penicillium capsulatum TaxID=69766 RepID=A0A9W9HMS5_9EURO|nr:hypothetical protein N7492_010661 [Penicillium capsulatum]KAJ6113160.1 hypothetical protein N7512_008484 [Penicillium capsulatum]